MVDIIVGERVINRARETGVVASFDDSYIYVDFKNRTAKVQLDAFDKGMLKYENSDLQNKVNESIEQAKIEEKQIAEKNHLAQENEKKKRFSVMKGAGIDSDVRFGRISVRLDPAPIALSRIKKKKDRELVQYVFNECDNDANELFELFKPKMEYSKYTSRSRSKYYVGFLTKYSDTYVFRVFSRNDIYKKGKTTGVTVMESDTTEIFRILQINGVVYCFSKNFSCRYEYYDEVKTCYNTIGYNKWQNSDVLKFIVLNEVIRKCDCEYLNDYISEKDINGLQYVRLLFSALYNNKAEIVFKNRLFSAAYRIGNLCNYLEEFSSKQIDFASKNDVINTVKIINQYGIYDIDILQGMETVMRKIQFGESIYTALVRIFKQLDFDYSDLGGKLIRFLERVDGFNARVYYDYINELAHHEGITVRDFFDKNYIARHDVLMMQKDVYYTKEQMEKYNRIAKELSWIDREENGYYIIVPKTISEFKQEGEYQHNCVYVNGYVNLVIQRQSIIVFLREKRDQSYVTIEFDYETFDVIQALGRFNKKIDSGLYKYIVSLGRRLHCEFLSQE